MTSVDRSMLIDLQGLTRRQLYRFPRGLGLGKTAAIIKLAGQRVGSKTTHRFLSMLGRSVWQLWPSSALYVMVPEALQEANQWTRDSSLRYRSVSGSWCPWADLLCRGPSKPIEIFRVWTSWFSSATPGTEPRPWKSTACWKVGGETYIKNLAVFWDRFLTPACD